MYYFGIDPGANYSGLAILDNDIFVLNGEYSEPVSLWFALEPWVSHFPPDEICGVIEDFLGSGASNIYRKKTVMALGYFQYRMSEFNVDLEIVPQQARLAYVSLVPKKINGKDEISAAAHALALRERRLRKR